MTMNISDDTCLPEENIENCDLAKKKHSNCDNNSPNDCSTDSKNSNNINKMTTKHYLLPFVEENALYSNNELVTFNAKPPVKLVPHQNSHLRQHILFPDSEQAGGDLLKWNLDGMNNFKEGVNYQRIPDGSGFHTNFGMCKEMGGFSVIGQGDANHNAACHNNNNYYFHNNKPSHHPFYGVNYIQAPPPYNYQNPATAQIPGIYFGRAQNNPGTYGNYLNNEAAVMAHYHTLCNTGQKSTLIPNLAIHYGGYGQPISKEGMRETPQPYPAVIPNPTNMAGLEHQRMLNRLAPQSLPYHQQNGIPAQHHMRYLDGSDFSGGLPTMYSLEPILANNAPQGPINKFSCLENGSPLININDFLVKYDYGNSGDVFGINDLPVIKVREISNERANLPPAEKIKLEANLPIKKKKYSQEGHPETKSIIPNNSQYNFETYYSLSKSSCLYYYNNTYQQKGTSS